MAWYLSEIVTDLSPIGEILALYERTGFFPEESFHYEYRTRLIKLLRQTHCNTDHIDGDAIPVIYENDEYKWLANGYDNLIQVLGLVSMKHEGHGDGHAFGLTDMGSQVLTNDINLPDMMRRILPEWRNDRGVHPYQKIIKTASELQQLNLYPCPGLLLLEVLILLQKLNDPYSEMFIPFEIIHGRRKKYYAHMTGDPRIDLIQYSDFLWEELSEDASSYYAANYPARSSLQLMMYAGELIYGPVPDEVFGLVQYVTTNNTNDEY